MELYGRNPARDGSQSGYQPEWSPARPETGLEESMWQLSVRGIESYPERPGVADCVYYMRTGYCGYGNSCRYNHPRNRAAVEAAVRATGEYPERPGEPVCQGEKECSYYLKTGQCKFGITCKFHHPQPAGTSMPSSAPQFYQPVQSPSVPIPEQYGGASTNVRVARPPPLPGSYVQGAYGPVLFSPGMVPIQGWSHYSAPVSPVLSPGAQPAVGATSLYGLTQLSSSTPSLAGPYPSLPSSTGFLSSNQEPTFPERPGEPECQYYLRTGDCKFGSSCRYHHPRDKVMLDVLSIEKGGAALCFLLAEWALQVWVHMQIRSSGGNNEIQSIAPSLIDMPRQFPVQLGLYWLHWTLPLLFAAWPELNSGSKKDTYLSRIPSSASTSSSSVGLIFFSRTVPVPRSDLQLSSRVCFFKQYQKHRAGL
ncbi:hypothetical protein V6N13_004357 [Hibiscus sabdariffa]